MASWTHDHFVDGPPIVISATFTFTSYYVAGSGRFDKYEGSGDVEAWSLFGSPGVRTTTFVPTFPTTGGAGNADYPALPTGEYRYSGEGGFTFAAELSRGTWDTMPGGIPAFTGGMKAAYDGSTGIVRSNGTWKTDSTTGAGLIPLGSRASINGGTTISSMAGGTLESGLYAYSPGGWSAVTGLPPWIGFPEEFLHANPVSRGSSFDTNTYTQVIVLSATIYPYADVQRDTEWEGGGGGTDMASVYGLAMDLSPMGAIRQVYNDGFNSENLRLRACDVPGTWTDAALPFTGRCPEILVLPNGRLWVMRESGGVIKASRSDDDGETWT